MRSGWLVGCSPPQLLDLSHLHDHPPSIHTHRATICTSHFLIISLPPTAPLGHQRGSAFQIRRCWTPQADRWLILPNHQGFAPNSPHSSPCQQLSCSPKPTIFSRPLFLLASIPNPCQLGHAFCCPPLKYSVPDQNPMFPH